MEDKENIKPAPGSRPVYLSIAFGNNTPHNVRVNDIVEVEGRMVAYPYFNETVEKWGFIQYLKADSIIPAVPELTKVFGEAAKGFSTERHYSRVYVKGVVIDKYKKESSIWHKLTLCVEGDQDDRRSSHIRAQYSDRMRVNDIQYEIGDTMALIGSFLAGCMFIFNAAVETGNVQVEAKGPDELAVKTRRRKYTETKLPENRHYGF